MLLTTCPLVSLLLVLLAVLGAARGCRLIRGTRTVPKDPLYGVLLLSSSTGLYLSLFFTDWTLNLVFGPSGLLYLRELLAGGIPLLFAAAVVAFTLDWLLDRRSDVSPPHLPPQALDTSPAPRGAAPTGVFHPPDAIAPPTPRRPAERTE